MGQILQRNFGAAFYPYYGLWDRYMFTSGDVAGMCDLHPHYACIASHMLSLDLPFDSGRFDFRAFAFVRHPVERALSLYFYSFRLEKENPGYIPPGKIEDFFAPILQNKSDGRFFNGQTKFLAGNRGALPPEAELRKLIQEKRLLLIPTERFDEGCMLLESRFPGHFRNASYGKTGNRSDRNQAVPESLRNELEAANREDRALYELACETFQNSVSEELGGPEQIAARKQDYDLRCRRQAVLEALRRAYFRMHSVTGKIMGRLVR